MKVSLNYKIPQEKVINFNWNDEVKPNEQQFIATIKRNDNDI